MTTRYYSSTAVPTTLATSATAGATVITVSSLIGYPTSFPFTLALDFEGSMEELVSVTSASGTSLTVTRGIAGTAGVSHSAGAVVKHVIMHLDHKECQDHRDATTSVHGITDTANLAYKAGPTLTGTTTVENLTATGNVVVPTADANGEAVNKGQMDAADALKASLTGATFTGAVTVAKSGTGQVSLANNGVAQVSLGAENLGSAYTFRVGNQADNGYAPAAVASATNNQHAVNLGQLTHMVQAGTAAGNTPYFYVTFPHAYATDAIVVVSNGDPDANPGKVGVKLTGRTDVGFYAQITDGYSGQFRVNWIAFGAAT